MSDLNTSIAAAVSDFKESSGVVDSDSSVEDTQDTGVESEPAVEASSDGSAEVEPETALPVEEKKVEPVAEVKAEDTLGEAHDKFGRENRIPHSRVQKLVAKAEANTETRIRAEYEPKLQGITNEYREYREVYDRIDSLFKNPPLFIEELRKTPGYAELLSQTAPAQAASDDMPGPDTDNGYSIDGLKKLLAWQDEQTEKRIAARVQPILNERAEAEFNAQNEKRIGAILEEARTWEGFTENQKEIEKEFLADKRLSLEGAYRRVVVPKLKSERSKMREEILAELKKAPTSTGSAPSQMRNTSSTPKSLNDQIKEKIREARLV